MKIIAPAGWIFGFLLFGSPTQAQVYNNGTATAVFAVTLNIIPQCTITAGNPLAFPDTGLLTSNVDAQTTFTVNCTNTTLYNLGLNAGDTPNSTVANRLLASTTSGSTATVQYQLYRTAARTTVWGNTQATDTVPGAGTGANQTVTVYGRVPTQAAAAPGSFRSNVTATVYF